MHFIRIFNYLPYLLKTYSAEIRLEHHRHQRGRRRRLCLWIYFYQLAWWNNQKKCYFACVDRIQITCSRHQAPYPATICLPHKSARRNMAQSWSVERCNDKHRPCWCSQSSRGPGRKTLHLILIVSLHYIGLHRCSRYFPTLRASLRCYQKFCIRTLIFMILFSIIHLV